MSKKFYFRFTVFLFTAFLFLIQFYYFQSTVIKDQDTQIQRYKQLETVCLQFQKNTGFGGFSKVIADIKENKATEKELAEMSTNWEQEAISNYIQYHGFNQKNENHYTLIDSRFILPTNPESSFVSGPAGEFGWRYNLIDGKTVEFHYGIDICNKYDKRIVAMADGKVIRIGFDKTEGGNYILIEHYFGTEIYRTFLCHLDKIIVNIGQNVKQGQLLGRMGQTGGYCFGEHVHTSIFQWSAYQKRWITLNPVYNSTYAKNVINNI